MFYKFIHRQYIPAQGDATQAVFLDLEPLLVAAAIAFKSIASNESLSIKSLTEIHQHITAVNDFLNEL